MAKAGTVTALQGPPSALHLSLRSSGPASIILYALQGPPSILLFLFSCCCKSVVGACPRSADLGPDLSLH